MNERKIIYPLASVSIRGFITRNKLEYALIQILLLVELVLSINTEFHISCHFPTFDSNLMLSNGSPGKRKKSYKQITLRILMRIFFFYLKMDEISTEERKFASFKRAGRPFTTNPVFLLVAQQLGW